MSNLFASVLMVPIVPFDASIDTPMGHRNLVWIYVVVWLVQLGYGIYAVRTWRASGKRRELD